MRKSEEGEHKLIAIEEEWRRIPRRGWAEMIRKVYEVDSLVCPECSSDYLCFSKAVRLTL